VRRHGWNATSFQVLEGGYRYWFEGRRRWRRVCRHGVGLGGCGARARKGSA
jgi:hypothetical protein